MRFRPHTNDSPKMTPKIDCYGGGSTQGKVESFWLDEVSTSQPVVIGKRNGVQRRNRCRVSQVIIMAKRIVTTENVKQKVKNNNVDRNTNNSNY